MELLTNQVNVVFLIIQTAVALYFTFFLDNLTHKAFKELDVDKRRLISWGMFFLMIISLKTLN
jgi:hypothetical protein